MNDFGHRSDDEQDSIEEIQARALHSRAIAASLWTLAATLVGAFVLGGVGLAWSYGRDITELRAAAVKFTEACADTKQQLGGLHTEVTTLVRDVAQLQFTSVATVSTLNQLTGDVKQFHALPTAPMPQGTAPAPAPPVWRPERQRGPGG